MLLVCTSIYDLYSCQFIVFIYCLEYKQLNIIRLYVDMYTMLTYLAKTVSRSLYVISHFSNTRLVFHNYCPLVWQLISAVTHPGTGCPVAPWLFFCVYFLHFHISFLCAWFLYTFLWLPVPLSFLYSVVVFDWACVRVSFNYSNPASFFIYYVWS